MVNRNNRFEHKLGRILAYLVIALATLLITGGGIALLKLLVSFIFS